MSDVQIRVQSDTVPAGFCFNGFESASWREILALMYVNVPLSDDIIWSQTPPGPAYQDKAWGKLDASDYPVRIYRYAAGLWLALHPIPVGLSMVYTGSIASITALDENADGDITPTVTHGPFWERVTEFNGRFLIGTGTLSGEGVTDVTPLATGGVHEVALALDEMPGHKHTPGASVGTLFSTGDAVPAGETAINIGGSPASQCYLSEDGLWQGGDTTADRATVAHNNIPPYCGITVLRRTARKFYRGA